MPDEALYVYGIVESSFCKDWSEIGLERKKVYTINEGNFSALVHKCKEKAYISKDPNKIKEMILSHNLILDKAMEDFNGVIPMHFNTIIKRGKSSAQSSLKMWISENHENLQRILSRVKGKREYGIRIYYDKEKVIEEVSNSEEIKDIETNREGKGTGLSYLLQSKAKTKINEIMWGRVNEFKKKFYDSIEKVTNNVKVTNSKVLIEEEKDLLLTLSVLVDELQIGVIKKTLEESGNDFSFQLAGPFAPYSFVDDENDRQR